MFLFGTGAGTIQDPPIVSRGMLRKESIRASKQLKAEARRQGIDAEKARVGAQPPLSQTNLAAVLSSLQKHFSLLWQVKQVLNSRQAADPQSGKSKPLLPKVTSLLIGLMNLDSTHLLL